MFRWIALSKKFLVQSVLLFLENGGESLMSLERNWRENNLFLRQRFSWPLIKWNTVVAAKPVKMRMKLNNFANVFDKQLLILRYLRYPNYVQSKNHVNSNQIYEILEQQIIRMLSLWNQTRLLYWLTFRRFFLSARRSCRMPIFKKVAKLFCLSQGTELE